MELPDALYRYRNRIISAIRTMYWNDIGSEYAMKSRTANEIIELIENLPLKECTPDDQNPLTQP